MVLEYHMPNMEVFGACFLIDLMAILHHITFGLPMKLELFVPECCDEESAETIVELANLFDEVVKVDFYLEEADISGE